MYLRLSTFVINMPKCLGVCMCTCMYVGENIHTT